MQRQRRGGPSSRSTNYGPDDSSGPSRSLQNSSPNTPAGEWTFDERELRGVSQSYQDIIVTPIIPRQGVYKKRTGTDPRPVRGFNVLAILRMRFTNTFFMTAASASTALDGCVIAPSPSTACRKRTAHRLAWMGWLRHNHGCHRKVHDFLTGRAGSLREAGAAAGCLRLVPRTSGRLRSGVTGCSSAREAGFRCFPARRLLHGD